MNEVLRAAKVVMKKELRESMRDKRTRSSLLLMPFIGLFTILLVVGQVGKMLSSSTSIELSVRGASHLPDLISFLQAHDVTIHEATSSSEELVRTGDLDLFLEIPESCERSFKEVVPCKLALILDSSRNGTLASQRAVKHLLEGYAQEIAALRLLARGVDPSIAGPVIVDERDMTNDSRSGARFLSVIPLLLLVGVFVSGAHVSIDMTAGERERQSLEPLLANPVSPRSIVLGKWATSLLLTWTGTLLTIIVFALALLYVKATSSEVRVQFDFANWCAMMGLLFPLAVLSTAIQLLIGTYARSFREAQMTAQLLSLLPAIPGMALTLSSERSPEYFYAIPVVGASMGANELLRGTIPSVAAFAMMTVASLVPAWILYKLIITLFARESILAKR